MNEVKANAFRWLLGSSRRTSDNAAGMRAFHLIHQGEPKILEDSYAIRLTSRFWRAIIENRFLYWLFARDFLYGWIPPVVGEVVARARYAEDQLESAIREGVSQYVLLSAGMDSFALRRPDLTDSLAIFEIDHPATQELKRKQLSELGIPLPRSLFFVPVDFERESLAEALSKSSFSAHVPAFFSWLGTVYYLEKSAVLQTLGDVASCAAKRSEIVFDYCDPEALEGKSCSETLKRMLGDVERRGEPWITGFHDKELFGELGRLGFEVVERLSSDEIQARYFSGRTDGLTMLDHIHFVCARLVGTERPAVAAWQK